HVLDHHHTLSRAEREAAPELHLDAVALGVAADSVLSPALGGVIVGHEVAASLGVPFRFTERDGVEMKLRRGFALGSGERVVVVEDVVTTGKSTLETAAVAEAAGARVVAIASIIDRSGGRHGFRVPYASLLTLDLPAWPAGSCPLCREGGPPAVKPGSRPQARNAP
ncbi:MAG: orotate phosphoribosyltransferase, partial [Thermoanaerobaculia bacterium]